MSIHSLPTVPLDPAVHHRLLVEASRRCRDGEDVRAVMARLVERSVAAVLGQLEQEDVDVHSRHCRCERCLAPPAPRFADGTMPGTETRCRGSTERCHTHGVPTVHRGLGPVCKVSGQRPEPSR